MLVGFCKISGKAKKWCLYPFYHVYQDRLVVLPSSEIAHFNVLYLIVNSSLAKTSDIRLSKIKPFQGKLSVFSILKWDAEPFLLLLNQINEYDWRIWPADHKKLMGGDHKEGVFGGLEHIHMDDGSVWLQVNHLGKGAVLRRSAENDEGVADGGCDLLDGVLGGRGEEVSYLQHQPIRQ